MTQSPGKSLKSAGISDQRTVSASLFLQCEITLLAVLPSVSEILSTHLKPLNPDLIFDQMKLKSLYHLVLPE